MSGAVGYGLDRSFTSGGTGFLGVNADWNCLFSISAFPWASEIKRPWSLSGVTPQLSDRACFIIVQNRFMPSYGFSSSRGLIMFSTYSQ